MEEPEYSVGSGAGAVGYKVYTFWTNFSISNSIMKGVNF